MTKLLCSTFISLFLFLSALSQNKSEVSWHLVLIKDIITSERVGNNVVYRLDSLQARFVPSRSQVTDYFNRNIDFGFKHRRINMSLNFAGYQIDLLSKNDTIYLASIKSLIYEGVNYDAQDKEVINQFLGQRNRFYRSVKTQKQLLKEISRQEEYAFYCGDGLQKTEEGKYIEQLVDEENTTRLIGMLKSFNCETQAYGVSGLEMLQKRDFSIPNDIKKLIDHIKTRNSELIICAGCLSGVIYKIYSIR